MSSTSLSHSKLIPPNGKGHPRRCHSALLLFHAGPCSDISRQFLLSSFVPTAAIIPDPNPAQDWRIWCLTTTPNFVIDFANQFKKKIDFAGCGPALWYLPDIPIHGAGSVEEWIYTFHTQLFPSALIPPSQRILWYLHSPALVSKQENYSHYYFLNRDIWKLHLKPYFLLFKTYYNLETARSILKLKQHALKCIAMPWKFLVKPLIF